MRLNPSIQKVILYESRILSQALAVNPVVRWLDDSQSPNAMAQYPGPQGTDGIVSMGVTLTGQIMNQFTPHIGAYGASVVVGMVLAHEFMHIHYYKQIRQGAVQQVRGKQPELLSDWYAGFYLNNRNWDTAMSSGGVVKLNAAIIGSAQQSYAMGDNNFTSPGHHGTHAERASAFESGVMLAEQYRRQQLQRSGGMASPYQMGPDAVFSMGRQYVRL